MTLKNIHEVFIIITDLHVQKRATSNKSNH
jgi:hypothetical protein